MGFDVTFHPIAPADLQHYLFDVLADPSLAEPRAREISPDPKRQKVVLKLYKAFPKWLAMKAPVGGSFAFGAAILAGFLRPYWYARGQGFSMLTKKQVPEAAALFTPLGQVVPGSKIADLPDPGGGRFLGNESASGPIPPERIEAAQALLESLATRPGADGRPLLETAFDADGLSSLRAALGYCQEHGLAMIEASDVVVPIGGECYTDQANMRAPFLGKMEA